MQLRSSLRSFLVLLALLIATSAFADRRAGEKVDVKWNGFWYMATVLEWKDGKAKVHYDEWAASWDEWVGPDRMRDFKPYAKGEKIDVEWKGKYWPASILEVQGNRYKIHYDNYGSEWDEAVSVKRIRRAR